MTATCSRAFTCWNVAFRRARVKGRFTGLNTTEWKSLFILPSIWTTGDRDVYPMASHSILQVMGQHGDDECTLATCVLHNIAKYIYNHRVAVNRIKVLLKTQCDAIPAYRFVIEYTIEGAVVNAVESRLSILPSWEFMLLQPSLNCSYKNLLSCERLHFLSKSWWRHYTIH